MKFPSKPLLLSKVVSMLVILELNVPDINPPLYEFEFSILLLVIVKVENADKLYKLQVDIGEKVIQIVSAIVPFYKEDELLGKKIVVIVNLEPTKFRGELSEGMLLAAGEKTECVLLTTLSDVKAGTKVC